MSTVQNESTQERQNGIVCCLSGAPSNVRVIHTAARMAKAFGVGFTAIFVETPAFAAATDEEKQHLADNMRLADELGARVTTLYGDNPAIQISEYVRASGASKIVLGLSPQTNGLMQHTRPLMNKLSELAPDAELYIIPDRGADKWYRPEYFATQERFTWRDFIRMLAVLAACTAVGFVFTHMGLTAATIVMVYILGVLGVSMCTTGRSYSMLASVMSVLAYNFFFTAPNFTLRSDPNSVATFAVMFIVALLGSTLTSRTKQQAVQSAHKAYRTEILLETSQKLQKSDDVDAISAVAAEQLRKLLSCDMVFYRVGDDGALDAPQLFPLEENTDMSPYLTQKENEAVHWVYMANKHAGITTKNYPDAACLYLAVRGSQSVLAVVGLAIKEPQLPDRFEKSLMLAILDECGLALEKDAMVRAKQRVEETARQEALRANLLRSVSHDLRTPLTSISGNAALLTEQGEALTAEKRQALYETIYDDSQWLINLVENLLSVTRIENGSMSLHREPELLDDIIREALLHIDRNSVKHTITVTLDDDLLMVAADARLIVQVVINIVNNAVKYTPDGSRIDINAKTDENGMVLTEISDNGEGVPPEARSHLFDMYYTSKQPAGDNKRGLGLGLALCRAIVTAHGGEIYVRKNTPHGACFGFTLPKSEVKSYE